MNKKENLNYRDRAYEYYLTSQVGVKNQKDLLKEIKLRSTYIKKLIKKFFPVNRDIEILDIGCGYGAFLYNLNEMGYKKLSGVDGSSEQVFAARSLGLSQISQSNIMNYLGAIPTSSKDFLIAYDVLEHQTKDELIGLMDEILRVLKSNGQLLIHVPNADGIFAGHMRYADITHEIAFTGQSLKQLGAITGFNNIKVWEDKPVIHGIKSLVRYLLWEIMRLPMSVLAIVESGDIKTRNILTQNIIGIFVK